MKTELTPKQERFCQEYARFSNASAAYRIAYNTENMQPETIRPKACNLLKQDNIRARVEEIKEEYAKKYAAEKDNVVRILCNIIGVNVDDLFVEEETDDGKTKRRLRNIEELPTTAKEAIKVISNNRGKVTYQFYDKMDAIRQLCSIMGWEKDKTLNINNRQDNTLRIGFDTEE